MITLIKNNAEIDVQTKKLAEEFVSSKSDGKRYAFGRNEHSQALLDKIKLEAVIDDYAPVGSDWNGLPIIKNTDLPKDAIVVNCVTCIGPITVKNLLEERGVKNFGVYALAGIFPEKFEILNFVKEARESYENNKSRWQKIYDSLEDEESRKTYSDILQYKLTGNYNFMTEYKIDLKEHYFEDFYDLKPREIFVDCGAFDGDTSEVFISKCPNYEKIYLFELSEINLAKAKERLKDYKNINYVAKGVSDNEEILSFNFEGRSSGICSSGEFKVHTTTIDNFIKDRISFIKMDIEGWELKALQGAQKHIKNNLPKLAISVYHKPDDFFEIFEFVKSIVPEYKVYLRQYTQGWSETVMFFIP